jgi:hypothetical protein
MPILLKMPVPSKIFTDGASIGAHLQVSAFQM